jgi:hypothetical protein
MPQRRAVMAAHGAASGVAGKHQGHHPAKFGNMSYRYDQPTSMAGPVTTLHIRSAPSICCGIRSLSIATSRTADIVAALRAKRDPHQEIIEAVLGFMTSDQFTMF